MKISTRIEGFEPLRKGSHLMYCVYAITPTIYFFYIPKTFLTENDIPWLFLESKRIFLRVNVTFYDAVNIIHDVIITGNLYPYTAGVCLWE